MNSLERQKAPWHLWAVGVITLLWHAVGATDYTMSQLRNRDYLEGMTGTYAITVDEMIAYIDGFPIWADASWALGVWGAVAGSVLLLLRSRFAQHAFIVSVIGAVVTAFYQFGSGDLPAELLGPGQIAFAAFILLVTLALALYARRMTEQGVLR